VPSDPCEEDYSKREPSAPEVVPNSRNVHMMYPQDMIASEDPANTVNGDFLRNPLLNVSLPFEPSAEDYSKREPSVLEAVPKYRNVQMVDPQDLIANEEPTKTVNGDPPRNPLLNVVLPAEPSAGDYSKCSPLCWRLCQNIQMFRWWTPIYAC
jgi:hypothetical protein